MWVFACQQDPLDLIAKQHLIVAFANHRTAINIASERKRRIAVCCQVAIVKQRGEMWNEVLTTYPMWVGEAWREKHDRIFTSHTKSGTDEDLTFIYFRAPSRQMATNLAIHEKPNGVEEKTNNRHQYNRNEIFAFISEPNISAKSSLSVSTNIMHAQSHFYWINFSISALSDPENI